MLRKEEDYIRSKAGTQDPFRVPEGYFEQLTGQLMQRLPQAGTTAAAPHRRTLLRRLTPARLRLTSAAAIAAVTLATGAMLLTRHRMQPTASPVHADLYTEAVGDEYIDNALDYAMVSNHEIASYLYNAN